MKKATVEDNSKLLFHFEARLRDFANRYNERIREGVIPLSQFDGLVKMLFEEARVPLEPSRMTGSCTEQEVFHEVKGVCRRYLDKNVWIHEGLLDSYILPADKELQHPTHPKFDVDNLLVLKASSQSYYAAELFKTKLSTIQEFKPAVARAVRPAAKKCIAESQFNLTIDRSGRTEIVEEMLCDYLRKHFKIMPNYESPEPHKILWQKIGQVFLSSWQTATYS